MSLILFLMSLGSMSHVDFKKGPCQPVEFKGQGPPWRPHGWLVDEIIFSPLRLTLTGNTIWR